MTPAKVMLVHVTDMPTGSLRISFEIVVYTAAGFADKFVLDVVYQYSTTQNQMRSLIKNTIIAECALKNYSVAANDILFALDV